MLPYAEVAEALDQAADRYEVSRQLVRAVAWWESRWNPNVRPSRTGARGIMQLMPRTAEGLGVQNIDDLHDNANGGAKYLAILLQRFKGSEHRAIAAYVWGPGNVRRNRNTSSWPMPVRRYVLRVQQTKVAGVSPELYARERGARDDEPSGTVDQARAERSPERKIDGGNVVPLSSSARGSSSRCANGGEGDAS